MGVEHRVGAGVPTAWPKRAALPMLPTVFIGMGLGFLSYVPEQGIEPLTHGQ